VAGAHLAELQLHRYRDRQPGLHRHADGRVWHPYSEAQVQSLIALLKDIVKRNNIDPRHIIGHSDIAPLRKLDPGPLFPWKRLADAGLGIWPDAASVARQQAYFSVNPPSVGWYQQELARLAMPSTRPACWMWPPAM
jgi:N-acetylmuramoyl-L-alanine amidase